MSLDNKSFQSLKKLLTVCLKQNIPFASYRLPLVTEIISLVQHHSFPEKLDSIDNIDQKTGFVVAPFDETNGHSTYFLKPDCVFFSNDIDDVYINKLSENNRFLSIEKLSEKDIQTTPSAEFINNVNSAKMAMADGKFHKVVLSKVKIEKLNDDFVTVDFFLKLCNEYPHAFVYFIQLPEVGCWIGATPEPFLLLEDGKVKTVSLAGTQIATGNDIDAYSWSEKEIEEQGIVTGFIESTLRSLKIDKYTMNGPVNYKAANLIHLKTSFEFNEDELQNKLGDFIKSFHPTPSVGGLPKDAALDFIQSHEKHDRSYYTGFLGPLNIENKSNLFVNLRCLQLFDKQFVLYSGAGITTSSIAENEWEETENKMQTMTNVMRIINP